MWLYVQEPVKGSYHPVKFGGRRHCGNEDIMIFVCYKILYDHMIKGSCDFMTGVLKVNYHFAKFGGHRHCGNGDTMILVCHVILQDHMIKGSWNFMDRSPSR